VCDVRKLNDKGDGKKQHENLFFFFWRLGRMAERKRKRGDVEAGEPTTGEPTTGEPTTAEPTTGEPTTAEPTTGEPTTGEPEPDTEGPKAVSTVGSGTGGGGEGKAEGEGRKADHYVVHIRLRQFDDDDYHRGDEYGVRCLHREDALNLAYQAASSWAGAVDELGLGDEPDPPVQRNETGSYHTPEEAYSVEDGFTGHMHLYDVWVEEIVLSPEPVLAYSTDFRRQMISRVVEEEE